MSWTRDQVNILVLDKRQVTGDEPLSEPVLDRNTFGDAAGAVERDGVLFFDNKKVCFAIESFV